jgi:hypothetical protein
MTADGREGELHPMYGVMANADFVEYAAALNWNVTDGQLSILHYVEGDVEAFEAAIREIDLVREYELKPAGDGTFYAYLHDDLTDAVLDLWSVGDRSGVVTVPPIEWHPDGTATVSVFGPSAVIQAAIDAVPESVTVTIEEISGMQAMPGTVASSLSERQREAVEAAVDVGYYDVPRTGSQGDVAARLDCASSTAAEHLQKAESRVFRALFG